MYKVSVLTWPDPLLGESLISTPLEYRKPFLRADEHVTDLPDCAGSIMLDVSVPKID